MELGFEDVGHLLTSDRRHGDVEKPAHPFSGHREALCELINGRPAAALDEHSLTGTREAVDRLDQMRRDIGHGSALRSGARVTTASMSAIALTMKRAVIG